jgi:hypothetical protein
MLTTILMLPLDRLLIDRELETFSPLTFILLEEKNTR